MLLELTAGWTGPVDMQLLADGVAVDLSGCAVALILTGRDGVLIDTTGDVSVITPANGTVRYVPDSTDLTVANSPYRFHFHVTDAFSRVVFFPGGAGDTIRVHRP